MSEVMTFLVIFWMVVLGMEYTDEYQTGEKALIMIDECEKDLPRDVKCVLVAKQSTVLIEVKENDSE